MSRKKITDTVDFLGIAYRIKKVRGSLTQKEFGKILDVRDATISRYESGRIPDVRTLNKIAAYGGVTVEWLLHGQEDKAEALHLREQAPEIYEGCAPFLDRDALAHIILLTRDWLRRKKDKLSALSEADLIARCYDYWLEGYTFPDDQVIAALRRLVKS